MPGIKRRLGRLEEAVPPPTEGWSVPATGAEAKREIEKLMATLKARHEELDAALASGNRKREARAATSEAQA